VHRECHQQKDDRAEDNENDNRIRHWCVSSAPNHWGNQHCLLGERVECVYSFRRSPWPNAKRRATELPLPREDALRFSNSGLRLGVAFGKALCTPTDPTISTSIQHTQRGHGFVLLC
jgi:hypothetical protein